MSQHNATDRCRICGAFAGNEAFCDGHTLDEKQAWVVGQARSQGRIEGVSHVERPSATSDDESLEGLVKLLAFLGFLTMIAVYTAFALAGTNWLITGKFVIP